MILIEKREGIVIICVLCQVQYSYCNYIIINMPSSILDVCSNERLQFQYQLFSLRSHSPPMSTITTDQRNLTNANSLLSQSKHQSKIIHAYLTSLEAQNDINKYEDAILEFQLKSFRQVNKEVQTFLYGPLKQSFINNHALFIEFFVQDKQQRDFQERINRLKEALTKKSKLGSLKEKKGKSKHQQKTTLEKIEERNEEQEDEKIRCPGKIRKNTM